MQKINSKKPNFEWYRSDCFDYFIHLQSDGAVQAMEISRIGYENEIVRITSAGKLQTWGVDDGETGHAGYKSSPIYTCVSSNKSERAKEILEIALKEFEFCPVIRVIIQKVI